ncbi:MAG: SOS response-associated peptidase [Corynebacteriales bacterium]|nr:SOS response-associated peptidase [Mycobacteriales bacterium]
MCGRYVSTATAEQLANTFNAGDFTRGPAVEPDYNVAPTKNVHIVRMTHRDDVEREVVDTARWGLIPSWAKDIKIGSRLFNARAESVRTTSAFRNAFARRRALIPADGWYEWTPKQFGPGKQAFYITPESGQLVFAGLWEVFGPDKLITCTILTTPAQGELARIHDRQPLVLSPGQWEAWLKDDDAAVQLLEHPDITAVRLRPVGSAVGNVANNGPSLISAVEEQTGPDQLF